MSETDPNRPELGPIHPRSRPPPDDTAIPFDRHQVKLLVVVEGLHDIRFLRRISRMLHKDNASLPDLAAWEQSGILIFVPTAGGDLLSWATRFAAFGIPEFHLYDREQAPETETRLRAASLVNSRAGCLAFVTGKRGAENYLHPQAIQEARGIELSFGDFDDVADQAARHCFEIRSDGTAWNDLPFRTKKRLRDRAKQWLNTWAVDCMTPALLAERDPAHEIRSWLQSIVDLAQHTVHKE